jgi:hypothetical protein
MPLNEATRRPSNLTRRERHEALAAIYGVPADVTEFDRDELREKLSLYPPEKDSPQDNE